MLTSFVSWTPYHHPIFGFGASLVMLMYKRQKLFQNARIWPSCVECITSQSRVLRLPNVDAPTRGNHCHYSSSCPCISLTSSLVSLSSSISSSSSSSSSTAVDDALPVVSSLSVPSCKVPSDSSKPPSVSKA